MGFPAPGAGVVLLSLSSSLSSSLRARPVRTCAARAFRMWEPRLPASSPLARTRSPPFRERRLRHGTRIRAAAIKGVNRSFHVVRGGRSALKTCGSHGGSQAEANKVSLSLVVAFANCTQAIGNNGKLIWSLQEDMDFFKNLTTTVNTEEGSDDSTYRRMNAVIMGRITWESIPVRFRPLKDRINIVVSSDPSYNSETRDSPERPVKTATSLSNAILLLKRGLVPNFSGQAFVIGGSGLYSEAMELPECKFLYVTRVFLHLKPGQYDRVFPKIDESVFKLKDTSGVKTSVSKRKSAGFSLEIPSTDLQYQFEVYERSV